MNSHIRYRVNRPDIVYETFEDETVIINLDSGNYYSFGGCGNDIWRQIESGLAVNEIVDSLATLYKEANTDMIQNAVSQSLAELEKEALIVADDSNKEGEGKAVESEMKNEASLKDTPFQEPILEKYTDMQEFLLVDPIHEIDYTDWPKKE